MEEEVRELALKIFKRKLGFMFKPNVEDSVIEELVTSEPFQHYIEEAEKQLEKRRKAVLNNKYYPVIEVPADGIKGVAGGAYVLCFVYTKHKGNFVLKGYHREVKAYLKKNYTHYFCNMSMQWMGGTRDFWKFWKESIGIHEPRNYTRGVDREDLKFTVRPYVSWDCSDCSDADRAEAEAEADAKAMKFKRMPKRWIPEFDEF